MIFLKDDLKILKESSALLNEGRLPKTPEDEPKEDDPAGGEADPTKTDPNEDPPEDDPTGEDPTGEDPTGEDPNENEIENAGNEDNTDLEGEGNLDAGNPDDPTNDPMEDPENENTGMTNSPEGISQKKNESLFNEFTKLVGIVDEFKSIVEEGRQNNSATESINFFIILGNELDEIKEKLDIVLLKNFNKIEYKELIFQFTLLKTEIDMLSKIFARFNDKLKNKEK